MGWGDGNRVGFTLGVVVGPGEGETVGKIEGEVVGEVDGHIEGCNVGEKVGVVEGDAVGMAVGGSTNPMLKGDEPHFEETVLHFANLRHEWFYEFVNSCCLWEKK